MRRHRFGRIAASLAAVYLAAAVVLAVVAQVKDEILPLWVVVVERSGWLVHYVKPSWWLLLLLVAAAAVQAWAYWQVLRGRVRGEPARHGRQVSLLRAALYADAGFSMLLLLPLPFTWWIQLISTPIFLAMTWLFFRVLRGNTPLWQRSVILVTGVLIAISSTVSDLDLTTFDQLPAVYWAQQFLWPVWMVLVLVAQARDPRWSRTTVWMGVVAVVMSLVQPRGMVSFSFGNELPLSLLFIHLSGAVSVFGLVWSARSAHDLGTLQPPRLRPERVSARRWPLPAVAVVLPLLPAAVNLAHGMPFWLGPKNVLWATVYELSSSILLVAWYALDLLVGVGGLSLLVLAVVWRRNRLALRLTTLSLLLMAAAAFVSAFTEASSDFLGSLPLYPDSLFVRNGALVSAGISPLWYGFALAASAVILLFLYGAPPTLRLRHHVLVAGLATVVLLCLVPAADQSSGPVTSAEECQPPEPWEYELEGEKPRELTVEQRFVCSFRRQGVGQVRFPETTPDMVVLAYGRRLCDAHTRNDARELADLKVTRESLAYPLAGICPSAAAVVKAQQAEQNREMAETEADSQRMCDATPYHKTLIKAAKAVRIKEPQSTDYGVLQTYETEGATEADMNPGNGLVSSQPGVLAVMTDPDFELCVTLETYASRPPVETKGWDKVVEVGYRTPTGEILLADPMGALPLPDLALDGRAGHYRIRVHYASFPWKGEGMGGQRLLIMAYKAPGDQVTVYREHQSRS